MLYFLANSGFISGLPGETWGMIAVIWTIVLLTVVFMWIKISKLEDTDNER